MNIKSMLSSFVSFDETEAAAVENKEKTSSRPVMSTPIPTPPPSAQPYVYVADQKISPEIKKHLVGLIQENNQEGFDYCEFMVQLETLSQFAIPVEQKYTSSYAAILGQAQLAKKEFSKTKLLTSADFYKTVIQTAIKEFQGEYDQTYKIQVEDNKAWVISKATEQGELANKMAKLQAEIDELKIIITAGDVNLNQNRDLFMNTGNTVLSELDAEIEKINQFIN